MSKKIQRRKAITFNEVPSVVVEMIFSYCSMSERLIKIECVCSFWLSLSKTIINNSNNINKQGNCGKKKLNNRVNNVFNNNIDLSELKWPLDMKVFVTAMKKRRLNHHEITSLNLNQVKSFNLIDYFSNLTTLSFKSRVQTFGVEFQQLIFDLMPSLTTLSINLIDFDFDCEKQGRYWITIPHIPSLLNLIVKKEQKQKEKDINEKYLIDIYGNHLLNLKSICCPDFLCMIEGSVSNLETCNVGNLVDESLINALSLRFLCVSNNTSLIQVSPNTATTLEILHLPGYFPLDESLFMFKKLRHCTFTATNSDTIQEFANIFKISTFKLSLTSICIYGITCHALKLIITETIKFMSQLTHINGYTKDIWIFTSRNQYILERNKNWSKVMELLWYFFFFGF